MIYIFDLSKTTRALATLTLIIVLMLLTTTAYAATVNRTKGKAVEILVDGGEDFVKGDTVFAVSNGKRVGKIKIVKIKGEKALGKLVKGKAPQGATIKISSKKASPEESTVEKDSSAADTTLPEDGHIGLLVGFSSNSQSVETTASPTETVKMTGSSLSYKAYGDLPLSESLGLIGRLGIENFNVTGTAANAATCSGTTACDTKLSYMTADVLIRYSFLSGDFQPFVSGGLGLAFPMSKDTNALKAAKIATTTIFYGGLGMNYRLSKSMYIPLVAEYGMFPPDKYVSTTLIAVRGGIGFNF